MRFGKVFLIDDCSNDNTKKDLKNLKINYLRNKINLGYERSLNKGFNIILRQKFKFLITMDADGQHKISDLNKMTKRIKNFDIVVGARAQKNNILEKILSFWTKKKIKLSDIICGLKAYNMEKFRDFKNSNDLIGTQYLLYGVSRNFNIGEIKIFSQNRKVGNSRYYSRLSNYLKIVKLIFLLKKF
tara:strand:- start:16077 stop:16634 length:558 start_codon:yes stop_codon:yes gene_type:complete